MPRTLGIGIDASDLGSRKIAYRSTAPAGRAVDDPIADRLPGFVQVTVRKMVPGLDLVVVSRPGF
jgi:hypothetical protein